MDFNSSEENIGWLRDRYREGTLAIKPPFQRKPVWAARQKCYLIESILLHLPVPELYVQQAVSKEGDTRYAIVDGQQRVRTVLQFIGAETDPEEQEHNKFALDKLDSSPWKNATFAELTDEEKVRFYGYRFAVRYLNTGSDDEVRDMFRRLNKYLTPLKPQELRNATYAGPFVALVESLADNDYWVENRIVTPALIRRMGDIEFVSELLIGVLHGPQGGSSRVIDGYYEQYEDYETEFPEQRSSKRLFELTLQMVESVLPNIKDGRWSNRTDFYTLFVGMASLLRTGKLAKTRITGVRKSLTEFAEEINTRLHDETAEVRAHAVGYVRAVEKGANDKRRRADRHIALMAMMEPHFTKSR